jgi:hypothetical protein
MALVLVEKAVLTMTTVMLRHGNHDNNKGGGGVSGDGVAGAGFESVMVRDFHEAILSLSGSHVLAPLLLLRSFIPSFVYSSWLVP